MSTKQKTEENKPNLQASVQEAQKAAENFHRTCGQGSSSQALEKTIKHRFTYHPPKPGQPEIYTGLRETAKQLSIIVARHTPEGREQNMALTKIEEAVMWANAAIARA